MGVTLLIVLDAAMIISVFFSFWLCLSNSVLIRSSGAKVSESKRLEITTERVANFDLPCLLYKIFEIIL